MKIPEFAQEPLYPPVEWLERWTKEAEEAGEIEPTAMSLSTVSIDGAPRARFVLCKGVSENGILFFTNLDSSKANEISSDPRASIAFHWPILNRQVRIEGRLQKTSDQEADLYFQTRSRLSKIGAWPNQRAPLQMCMHRPATAGFLTLEPSGNTNKAETPTSATRSTSNGSINRYHKNRSNNNDDGTTTIAAPTKATLTTASSMAA